MNSQDNSSLLGWRLGLQFKVAPAEDRALRGRNPSAAWRLVNGRSGWLASPACPCRFKPQSEKSTLQLPPAQTLARRCDEKQKLSVPPKTINLKQKMTRTSVSTFSGKVHLYWVLTGLRLQPPLWTSAATPSLHYFPR